MLQLLSSLTKAEWAKSFQRFSDSGTGCVFEWDNPKLYSTGIPAAHLLIPQVRNCSGFPRLWPSSHMHKTYSLTPFWYEAASVLMEWTWSPAASLSRPPATPLGCCSSTARHVILPAKILSSAAAASISSSSLQIVTWWHFFGWMRYLLASTEMKWSTLPFMCLCLNILLPPCTLKVTILCP